MVALWQSGSNRAQAVVFGQKWLYSNKVVGIGEIWLYSVKDVVIGQKWLF